MIIEEIESQTLDIAWAISVLSQKILPSPEIEGIVRLAQVLNETRNFGEDFSGVTE